MMRVGLSSAAFYGVMETEKAAARLLTLPVDVCEIFLETHSEYRAPFGRKVRRALGTLPCKSIHTKGTQFEPDLFGASPRQRKDAFRILEGALDCGAALGASCYVFHGTPDYRGGLTPLKIPRLAQTLQEMCRMSAERGISLCWENVFWCALKTPEDAKVLLEACPEIYFVLDIKQAILAGQDPLAFPPVMGSRLKHIHVLDRDKDGRLCLPGQGQFDFYALYQALLNIGYEGEIILEPYPAQAGDEEALRKSLDYLRSIFQ